MLLPCSREGLDGGGGDVGVAMWQWLPQEGDVRWVVVVVVERGWWWLPEVPLASLETLGVKRCGGGGGGGGR